MVGAFRVRFRTAGGQAAALFVLAGTVGLVNVTLPGPTGYNRPLVSLLNIVAIAAGLIAWFAPWSRWPTRATIVLVPVALGLVCLSDAYGGTPAPVYGVYFVVVFAWVGMWHPPGTAVRLALPSCVAYLLPVATAQVANEDFIRSVGVVIPVCVILGEVMAATVEKMRQAHDAQEIATAALAAAMVTDELTGLGNRRKGDQLLESLHDGDALLLIDLDRFKVVNDTFGHAEGDRLLTFLGQFLRGALHDSSESFRYGGDELVIIHRADGHPPVELAERVLHGWRLLNPTTTLSIGIAVHHAGHSLAQTFGEADSALYEAKRAGRDRVHMHEAVPTPPRPDLQLVPRAG
ncbi:MAG: diguanylate cyclase [Acidimicrobiaceae bacterium]|jgi:diguanylate cyclase (GGDEF)-like protein